MRAYAPLLFLPLLIVDAPGCGRPAGGPPEPPERVAERVFKVAQGLENEHKTRQAVAAYRQIIRHYPGSPQAGKAADRISRAQTAALGKRR